jgi:hypothetical protein
VLFTNLKYEIRQTSFREEYHNARRS